MNNKNFITSKKKLMLQVITCTAFLILFCCVCSASPYEIRWSTIDGGGGRSTSGDYILTGTIGQPDAGNMMGGDYEVLGGFWCGGAISVVDLHHYAKFARQWRQAGELSENKIIASDGIAGDDFGHSVSVNGDYAVVGAPWTNGIGSAYLFKYEDPNWVQKAELTPSDGAYMDYFGTSVSISGDYVIVGVPSDSHSVTNAGSAYIFEKPTGEWTDMNETTKLTASDAASWDYFGCQVAIDGNYAIIGASGDDDNGNGSGSAYIFERVSGTWTQQAKLLASDTLYLYDSFGCSVSISGDYVIVGAYGDDDPGSERGSAYIFKKPAGGWVNGTQTAKLTASDGAYDDGLGRSVSIDGNYAIVDSLGNDANGIDSGAAYIFEKPVTGWVNSTETCKLVASDAAANDGFGIDVDIKGDRAIVGAWRDDDNAADSGSVYVFRHSGSNWTEQYKLNASDAANSDHFGWSVSLSDMSAVVGAVDGDGNQTDSGAAYIFSPTAGDLIADLDGDGDVDLDDLALFADKWLCPYPDSWPLK